MRPLWLAIALAGCGSLSPSPDAGGDPIDAANQVDACPTPLGPGDGDYLLAVMLPGGTTYQFLAVLDENECQQTLSLMATALTTTDRTPVGATNVVTDVPYAGDGTFTAMFGTVVIPDTANPAGPVTLTLQSVTLAGDLRSDRMCGTVTGQVVNPYSYDLAGSVWGAIPAGSPLPAPDVSCP